MNMLLIANDPIVRRMIETQLDTHGYTVTACDNHQAALTACQRTFYPLIILDLRLPEMDSIALCRQIRNLPQSERSMILAVIAGGGPEELPAVLEAGADDFLIIPVSPDLLKVRITILERQSQRRIQRKQSEEALASTREEMQQAEEELRAQNAELLAANTELRQIQEQLEESRQTYSDLYNFAPVGYCTFDKDGYILEANLTVAGLLGVERGRFINTRFYHVIAEPDRDQFFLHLRALQAGQTQQACDLHLIKSDGSLFVAHLETRLSLTDEAQVVHYRTAISDVTERAQMEEELQIYRQRLEQLVEERTAALKASETELRQEIIERKRADQAVRTSEQQYRLLAENVADGIAIIRAGRLVFANDALAAMLGYAARQLVGQEFADLIRADYHASFQTQSEQLAQGVIMPDWQAVCVTKDGREVWTEARHRLLEWEGQPAILATIRDITSRKQREQAIEEERAHLRKENLQLRAAIEDRARFGEMVGKSPAMQEVYAQIVTAAAVDANVLISGESGTGKELVARTIHQLSARKTQEFVAVNCGAIPENLFEREFFGHRRGTFTGADKDAPGLFDRAHKGTLFLDEIGELSPAMQVKLLRVIESGEYTPVGDNRSKKVNVRLIAATNKNLELLVKQGGMREDFFYRIYVLVITMPPLRNHREDIPLLIEHFLQQQSYEKGERRPALPDRIVEILSQRQWPGNVRELYNVLHRYLQENRLDISDTRETAPVARGALSDSAGNPTGTTFHEAIEAYEQRLITDALERNAENMAKAAASLGMPLRTLYRKIKTYRLR